MIDQGFLSTAAVTACYAASVNPDPITAILAGLLAIGNVAIGAQRDVVALIEQGIESLKHDASRLEEVAESIAAQWHSLGRPVPGLGSPLHSGIGYDPRAERLRTLAEHYGFAKDDRFRLFALIHRFTEKARGRPIPVNIDGIMGAILASLDRRRNLR